MISFQLSATWRCQKCIKIPRIPIYFETMVSSCTGWFEFMPIASISSLQDRFRFYSNYKWMCTATEVQSRELEMHKVFGFVFLHSPLYLTYSTEDSNTTSSSEHIWIWKADNSSAVLLRNIQTEFRVNKAAMQVKQKLLNSCRMFYIILGVGGVFFTPTYILTKGNISPKSKSKHGNVRRCILFNNAPLREDKKPYFTRSY